MNEQEIVRVTQRIPVELHAFAKEEAYRQRMSLNDYINSLISKAKDAPAFVFEMAEEDYVAGLESTESIYRDFEEYAKKNNIKITFDTMLNYSASKVAESVAEQLREELQKRLVEQTKDAVKKAKRKK